MWQGGRMDNRRIAEVVVVLAVAVLSTACSSPDTADPVAAGASVFARRCATCHGDAAAGTPAGPALTDVSAATVTAAVTDGIDVDPAFPPMPALPLTDAQVGAVVAYLEHLGVVTEEG